MQPKYVVRPPPITTEARFSSQVFEALKKEIRPRRSSKIEALEVQALLLIEQRVHRGTTWPSLRQSAVVKPRRLCETHAPDRTIAPKGALPNTVTSVRYAHGPYSLPCKHKLLCCFRMSSCSS